MPTRALKSVDLPVFGIADQGDASAYSGRRTSIPQWNGHHQHVEQLIGAEADLAARHADDAGVAGPKHFDPHAVAEAEFLQMMDMIGIAQDAADAGGLAGLQVVDWDGRLTGCGTGWRSYMHGRTLFATGYMD